MKLAVHVLLAVMATAVDGFSTSTTSRIPTFGVPSSSTALSMRSSKAKSSNVASQTTILNAATMAEETITQEESQPAAAAKSYLDDGFVFGLEGSGLARPKGKEAVVVVEGDDLETQPWQVAFVSATFLGLGGFAATAFMEMLQNNGGNLPMTTLQSTILFFSSWVIADFGSGVLHWSVDNYGNGRTPIMGSIIAAFQGHHSAPWTITQRGFFNNVSKLCIPFGLITMSVLSAVTGPSATFFLSLFCGWEILSQEFHKWSHTTKSQVPDYVNKLQSLGLTIGRPTHAQHHFAPYKGNYCIVSGFCNPWLDNSGFFRRLEHVVYRMNGIEANAWKLDSELKERTLGGEYELLKK